MTQKPRVKADLLEHEIEQALKPGVFIPDRACSSFVSDLDEVAARIAMLDDTDPARAVALYETFLAGCYEKAKELDDSSGGFGQRVVELFCGWIKSRQAEGADPDEAATRLLGRMVDDPCGFRRAGVATGRDKTVSQVRADHRRKTGFLSRFERLVAGAGLSSEPAFLERAKARWSGRRRRDG